MEVTHNKCILVIITTSPDKVSGGGVPVFTCKDKKEMEKVAFTLSKLVMGSIHQVTEDIYVIVRH